jgi:ring-1,2-phenylacetyl-CoA epoxidase subunit PaaC
MNDPRLITPPTSPLSAAVTAELLALADDELIIGHRHSEWLGLSPFLEEDLTLSSIAQDEFGHARALYALIWPDWEDREAGVTRRAPHDWRSSAFVELAGDPWERSLVRHFYYDLAEPLRWTATLRLASEVSGLDQLVPTVLAEERFHRRHAIDLVQRLAADPEGARRLQVQLDQLAPIALSLIDSLGPEGAAAFAALVTEALPDGLRAPQFHRTPSESSDRPIDRSVRSAAFAEIHSSLLAVVEFDPAARW